MAGNGPNSIAIVAALEREIAPLVQGWDRRKLRSGTHVFTAPSIVAVAAGIGSNAARIIAKALLEEVWPSLLISVGLAGAISPSLKVGDLVLPEKVINRSEEHTSELQ